MDEKELIGLLKQGNKEAFTVLYKRYWGQVYHFSRLYLTNFTDAEDVVQDVFVKVWENREWIQEDKRFEGLLFIITRNLIFNQYRKKVNEEFYKVTVLEALEKPEYIEEIDAHNLQEYIERLIDELPPRRREIFNLSRKEQKSYREIADLLQISEKTVENQIREALKYLKKNVLLLLLFC